MGLQSIKMSIRKNVLATALVAIVTFSSKSYAAEQGKLADEPDLETLPEMVFVDKEEIKGTEKIVPGSIDRHFEFPVTENGALEYTLELDVKPTSAMLIEETDFYVKSTVPEKMAREGKPCVGFGPIHILNVMSPYGYVYPETKGKQERTNYFFAAERPDQKLEFFEYDADTRTITRMTPKKLTIEPNDRIVLAPTLSYARTNGFLENGGNQLPVFLQSISIKRDHQYHIEQIVNKNYLELVHAIDAFLGAYSGEVTPSLLEKIVGEQQAKIGWNTLPDRVEEKALIELLNQYAVDYGKKKGEAKQAHLPEEVAVIPFQDLPPPLPEGALAVPLPGLPPPKESWYAYKEDDPLATTGRWLIPGYLNPLSRRLDDEGRTGAAYTSDIGGKLLVEGLLSYAISRLFTTNPEAFNLREVRSPRDPLPYPIGER